MFSVKKSHLVVFVLCIIVIFVLQMGSNGMIANPHSLCVSLHAVQDNPWGLGEQTPFCYRPAFRWIVLGVLDALPERWNVPDAVFVSAGYKRVVPEYSTVAFYNTFILVSALALLFAVLAFRLLLKEMQFSDRECFWGSMLFVLGFPIVFSYDAPVQTKEDFLGYAWISLTLIYAIRDKPYQVAFFAAIGAWIRETCLLGLLPFWFISKRKTSEKIIAYMIPAFSLFCVRLVQGTQVPTYYLDLIKTSTAPTREFPTEALLYLFACFGALWITALWQLWKGRPRHVLLAPRIVLLAFIATAGTGWTMGMIRENRITYILYPFVIALSLEFFRSDEFRKMIKLPFARYAGFAVLCAGLLGGYFIAQDVSRVNVIRPWIGESFHLGVSPVVERTTSKGSIVLDLVYAPPKKSPAYYLYSSRLNGIFVLLHLSAFVFFAVAIFFRKRQE